MQHVSPVDGSALMLFPLYPHDIPILSPLKSKVIATISRNVVKHCYIPYPNNIQQYIV